MWLRTTVFANSVSNPEVKAKIIAFRDKFAILPEASAQAMAYAIEQLEDVDVGEIIVRPTAQG